MAVERGRILMCVPVGHPSDPGSMTLARTANKQIKLAHSKVCVETRSVGARSLCAVR